MIRLAAFLMLCLCALPAAAQSRFASDRISVATRGSGPDVILIPGLSSSPEVWDSTIAAVPGYRYHLVQIAGFAGAPAGANASGPVVGPVAEEVARYIAEARLARPALVGHSLGGTVALMIAARHPDRVGRLMAVDMVPYLGAMFGGPGASPERVQAMAAQFRSGIATATGEARRRAIEQTIAGMVRTEALRPGVVTASLNSDAAVSGQAMYDVITTDLTSELRNVRAPLTVLYVLPPGAPLTAEQLDQFYRSSYANTPQAALIRIPDSLHFIMLDAPEAFQRELRAFLTR